MTYHLPVLPDTMAGPGADWYPKESFSPSQLVKYGAPDACKRQWAWGSLFGVWSLKKSIAALLGSLIHGCLEHYLRGGTIYDISGPDGSIRLDQKTWKEFQTQLDRKWLTYDKLQELVEEAKLRALPGLRYIPDTKDPALEIVEVEKWIKLDTSRIIAGVEPIRIPGKIDLSVRRAGIWYLYDHKSTRGKYVKGLGFDPWYYCKKPDDLLTDPQAIFYALDLMLRHRLDALWIRWVYYLTDTKSHPLAKELDVELRFADVMEAAYKWLLVANEMRQWVRRAARGEITPLDVPANPEVCPNFGGCTYHYSKGGPCMPEGQVQLGQLITSGIAPGKEETMSLAAQLQQTQAMVNGAGAPPPIPQNPLIPPEAHQTAPAAAPPLAALPDGWVYVNGIPKPAPPGGCFYGQDGVLYQGQPSQAMPAATITVPPPAAAAAPPPAAPAAAPVAPAAAAAPPAAPPAAAGATLDPHQPEAPKRGRGRPPGAKNKKGDDATDDTFDRLLQSALDAPDGHPLRSLTTAQLRAIKDVIESE